MVGYSRLIPAYSSSLKEVVLHVGRLLLHLALSYDITDSNKFDSVDSVITYSVVQSEFCEMSLVSVYFRIPEYPSLKEDTNLLKPTYCPFRFFCSRHVQFLESWTALSTSSNPEDANALSRIPTDMSGGGLDSQPVLSLPKPNPFIPSEFTIKASMNGSTAVRRTSDDASGNDKGQTQKVSTGRSKGENRGKPEVVPVKKMKPTDKEPVANVQAGPPCPRLVKETVSDDTVGRGKTKVSMWHLQDSIFLQPRAELYLKVRGNALALRVCRMFSATEEKFSGAGVGFVFSPCSW